MLSGPVLPQSFSESVQWGADFLPAVQLGKLKCGLGAWIIADGARMQSSPLHAQPCTLLGSLRCPCCLQPGEVACSGPHHLPLTPRRLPAHEHLPAARPQAGNCVLQKAEGWDPLFLE